MNKPLAYRLRRATTFSEKKGLPVLMLDFPLKVLRLDPFWTPLLISLSGPSFVPFEAICASLAWLPPLKIESFLNDLVAKGFLEFEGISPITEYPSVSIIIPVRNRPEEIAACLESLVHIDYPSEKMEILVVDDCSTDDTPEVVSRFPVRLFPLKEHKQASHCRNLASREARGEILAFIDSDCLADPLWLKELLPSFKDRAIGAVGGVIEGVPGEKGLDRYEEVKSSLKIGSWYKRSRKGDRFFYLPSCNLLVRRELFIKLNGFREDLMVGEDVDFCWRLQDNGGHLEFKPQGKIHHQHRNSLKPFCQRRFEYGTSEPWLQRHHSRRRKHLLLYPAESLFWVSLIAAELLFSWPLVGLSGGILFLDGILRLRRLGSQNISLTYPKYFSALFRSYLVFFYYWAAFCSRYFLWAAILLFPLWPFFSLFLIGLHLLTALVEYGVKTPRLLFPAFLFYFTLDQLSYQLGVWWGCLKNRCFHPVNPVLSINRHALPLGAWHHDAVGPLDREKKSVS